MRTTRRHGRKVLALGILCVGGVAAFGLHGRAEAPADADVFVINGHLTFSAMSATLAQEPYSIGPDVQCGPISAGPASVPGFIDATGAASGECTGVTGGGAFTLAHCDTGLISADWNLPEPASSSVAHFVGQGVVVGGIAVVAAPPGAGYAYTDESGTGGGVALATLAVPTTEQCGSNTDMAITAVVAGAY